ncbi:MAG: pyridoxal phosphate-dependent aminotransferase [Candidatus Cloacimonetes bacterium]|nr:pyridoxal phosphate-dependent aminotransferase [Candidatus Cloacimonadota bacterium]
MTRDNLSERMKFIQKSDIRKIFDHAPADAINMGLGEIQLPLPEFLLREAEKILSEKCFFYTPNAGLWELRKLVSEYYQQRVIPEDVCITVGAEEALFCTILTMIDPGDQVMIADPGFVAYEKIIRLAGGIPIFFNLDPDKSFRLDFTDFHKKISEKTRLILFSYPSNPLGTAFSRQEVDFLIEQARKHSSTLIVDEVYRELYIKEPLPSFLEDDDSAIIISGLSKSHCMTGWRLGWAVSPRTDLITAITNTHQYVTTCAPYISQKLAIKALSASGLNWIEDLRSILDNNRNQLIDVLISNFPDLAILSADSHPYLFISFGSDDRQIASLLSQKGITVIPGSVFGENGKNWIRINYALPDVLIKKVFTKLAEINNVSLS